MIPHHIDQIVRTRLKRLKRLKSFHLRFDTYYHLGHFYLRLNRISINVLWGPALTQFLFKRRPVHVYVGFLHKMYGAGSPVDLTRGWLIMSLHVFGILGKEDKIYHQWNVLNIAVILFYASFLTSQSQHLSSRKRCTKEKSWPTLEVKFSTGRVRVLFIR